MHLTSFQTKLVQKNGEVSLTGKAYNNRVITGWLAEELRTAVSHGFAPGDVICSLTSLCVTLVQNRICFKDRHVNLHFDLEPIVQQICDTCDLYFAMANQGTVWPVFLD